MISGKKYFFFLNPGRKDIFPLLNAPQDIFFSFVTFFLSYSRARYFFHLCCMRRFFYSDKRWRQFYFKVIPLSKVPQKLNSRPLTLHELDQLSGIIHFNGKGKQTELKTAPSQHLFFASLFLIDIYYPCADNI